MTFIKTALAAVFLMAALALGTSARAASCPEVHVVSRDGDTYAAVFSDGTAFDGSATVTLYTANAVYILAVPTVSIPSPGPGHVVAHSKPVGIANPGVDPFDAIAIGYVEPTLAMPCSNRETIPAPGTAAKDAAVAKLDTSTPLLVPVYDHAEAAPTCATPFADASIDGAPASPAYPSEAVAARASGQTNVLVSLANTGYVDGTAIYRSSGSPVLDAAAMSAAGSTKFKPQIFRCNAVPSSYIFHVEFQPH